MVRIELNGISMHAYHGVHQVEKDMGGDFRIDVSFEYDATEAIASDLIDKALDYERVFRIVERCMAARCDLIETVASRIKQQIELEFITLKNLNIRLCKLNPPVSGKINEICVVL
jgi:dihydroneopterin aldolase